MSGGPPAENAGELAPPELRLRHCLATGSAGNPNARPEPLRLPAPLPQLPWDVAKDQFGAQGADFLGVMGALILRARKDQIRPYLPDPAGVPSLLPSSPEKTSPGLEHTESRASSHATGVSPTAPPLGAPASSPRPTAAPAAGIAG